jgi:hypothetical protein
MMNPNFEQCIDVNRPHTLLTENTQHCGSLLYRYNDTGESVTVPNIWYNQTYQVRVQSLLFEAARTQEMGEKFMANPPSRMSAEAAQNIGLRYLERAERIRSEARRMQKAAIAGYPVAASRMELDFGEHPSI